MKGYHVYSKIQQFRMAGFSQRQVARRLGINRKTGVQIAVLNDKPFSVLPLNSWQLIYGDIRNCNSHIRIPLPL